MPRRYYQNHRVTPSRSIRREIPAFEVQRASHPILCVNDEPASEKVCKEACAARMINFGGICKERCVVRVDDEAIQRLFTPR